MSAIPHDFFSQYAGARETGTTASAFHAERRARTRTRLHWPVLLLRDGGATAIDTVTQNLSSDGFYCLSPTPLAVGESLSCALKVPAYDPNGDDRQLVLECRAAVIRVEVTADGVFGIACRIEDYHLAGGQRNI